MDFVRKNDTSNQIMAFTIKYMVDNPSSVIIRVRII